MTQRLNLYSPEGKKPLDLMLALENYLANSSLDHGLINLIKVRASQINGCAYCLHMHTSDALKEGETPARLFLLDAWRESRLYTPKERAALTWTESLTRISETHAPDEDYEAAKAQFGAQELVDLTLAIATINSWNRIAIGFRGQHPNDMPAKQAA